MGPDRFGGADHGPQVWLAVEVDGCGYGHNDDFCLLQGRGIVREFDPSCGQDVRVHLAGGVVPLAEGVDTRTGDVKADDPEMVGQGHGQGRPT